MHQDVAPMNLLIDPETQRVLLFDFDWAACGQKNLLEGRDDTTGAVFTLYEIITGDGSFANIPHWERKMDRVQNLTEWPSKLKSSDDMQRYLNARNRLT
ncbi:hypothetical protein AU210_011178 [Fusarium oxysporum f. sp. radicis-cucumerinum]|uniref:Protein kinase domain-containing protein n=1 Tax=Fusarium oxysporum f. sp. radicis-cucumerinum TaxID=327505 RepID=A0A2H3GU38_FUSOX|nr:hypothetical protein AU210_011178 [Fusarium oxysporum f. sp. radicis-cucumerinum]